MAQRRSTVLDRTPPSPSSRGTRDWRWNALVVLVGVAVGVGIFFLGYAVHSQQSSHAVRVDRTFTGTVTIVSGPGDSGCVKPDKGGRPVCSKIALIQGTAVHQGDKVQVAHEWVKDKQGNGYDLLLVYPPRSP